MYRNVSYHVNQDKNGIITLYTWTKDGDPITETIEHNTHVIYHDDKNTKSSIKSIYGRPCSERFFKNTFERKKFIETFVGHERDILEAKKPEVEFLTSKFIDCNELLTFQQFPLRIQYLDIEIAVSETGEFPEPTEARQPINVITIFDTKFNTFFVFVLGEITRDLKCKNTKIFQYKTEESFLEGFVSWFSKNYPDILTGWNTLTFDIPYLFNRITNILGTKVSQKLSPENNVFTYKKFTPQGGQYDHVKISGISHLDYMILYRDKFQYRCPTGFSLDSVGEHEVKMQKDATLHGVPFYDRWTKHFNDYVDYNIQDVNLLVELDKKLRLIDLTRKMCNICLTPYETIYASIPYLSNGISIFSMKKNKRIFPSFTLTSNVKEQYEGAYVKEPEKGFYSGGIVTVDFNSLYPNTVIALNLSPETKVGRIIGHDKTENTVELKKQNGQIIKMPYKDLSEKIAGKTTLSSNKVLFLKPSIKQGIVPAFLKHFYGERVKLKKSLKSLRNKLSTLTESGTKEADLKLLIEEIKRGETQDIAYKGFLNSIYGMFGTPYSPIYDVELAESITLTGQMVIKFSIKYIDEYFKNKYGIEKSVILSDTDSVTGDTTINISNDLYGPFKPKISKFFEYISSQYPTTYKICHELNYNEKEIYDISSINILTLGYDSINNKAVKRKLNGIMRHKTSKIIYRITVDNGKSIDVTEDHSCIVKRNNNLLIVKPSEMLSDDLVIVV